MNKKLGMFLAGTKFQDFFAASLSFTFLLIFYQLSDSVLYSGVLTAVTAIVSRIVMFFLVPICKSYSPIHVTSTMTWGVGVLSLLAAFGSVFWEHSVFFYFVCSVLFSMLQEMRQSFAISIIPRIVDQAYLFKANSLNGMFVNVSQILAPLLSYFFITKNLIVVFLIYFVISCMSALCMIKLKQMSGKLSISQPFASSEKRFRFFFDQWYRTIHMIGSNKGIMYCLSIGVLINILFAGINGPFLLKVGNGGLGSALIKVSLSVGSLLGVYGAFLLKVKDRYQRYLKISLVGVAVSLLVPVIMHSTYTLLTCMVVLTLFVMFIMNTTGSMLQVVTPLHELPAVYEVRSTIYSIVVPTSYVVIGWILERWSYKPYFLISSILILGLGFMFRKKGFELPEQKEVEISS